jgi:hypothetical protein
LSSCLRTNWRNRFNTDRLGWWSHAFLWFRWNYQTTRHFTLELINPNLTVGIKNNFLPNAFDKGIVLRRSACVLDLSLDRDKLIFPDEKSFQIPVALIHFLSKVLLNFKERHPSLPLHPDHVRAECSKARHFYLLSLLER